MKKKTFAMALTGLFILGCLGAATLAWLIDKTGPVENTFTTGNIEITLAESTTDYKMVPGHTISKDPEVSVEAGSEACFVFVKVDKSDNFDDFMTYTKGDDWTALDGADGVYYLEQAAISDDSPNAVYPILKNDQVMVKSDVTKEMMDAIENGAETQPTLTFTAYAIQKMKDNDTAYTAAEAWNLANSN